MTKQQIFDAVAYPILKQGKAQCGKTGSCLYRTSDGKKCAIGMLIPDNLYTPQLEGCGLRGMLMHPEQAPQLIQMLKIFREIDVFPEDYPLLIDLQRVHDSYSVDGMMIEFRRVAIKHNLEWNEEAASTSS